jgi:hypothetical protein
MHVRLTPFALMTSLHPLIIGLTLLGWLHPILLSPTYSIIYFGNIIFYLILFDLHTLFQEHS